MVYTIILSSLSNSSFIHFCDSNIGLFCIASCKFVAFTTIAIAIVVALKSDSEDKGKIIALFNLEGDSDMCTFTLRYRF